RASTGQPGGVRKVRAPQRTVAGNARPPRGEDQRHSDDAFPNGPGARRAGVKRGKLYPEQGQVGGRNPVRRGKARCPALGSAARAGGQPPAPDGWPSPAALRRRRDRTRLTGRLAGETSSEILRPMASRISALDFGG